MMKDARVNIDKDDACVHFDGKPLPMPHKPQQVLLQLVAVAPEVVTSHDLIDSVWRGNFLTGEKGVRQAIWTIRAALGDDASSSDFIRTIPRSGYQWVGPVPDEARDRQAVSPYKMLRPFVAAAIMISLVFGGLLALPNSKINADVPLEYLVSSAEVKNDAIHIRFESGCTRILTSSRNILAGEPVISDDQQRIVFPVIRDESCQLVMFEPGAEQKVIYSACPDLPYSPLEPSQAAKSTI